MKDFKVIKLVHDDGTETEVRVHRRSFKFNHNSPNWIDIEIGAVYSPPKASPGSIPGTLVGAYPTFKIPVQANHRIDTGDFRDPGPPPVVSSDQKPVCECGKEKHGFAKHAGWCKIKD